MADENNNAENKPESKPEAARPAGGTDMLRNPIVLGVGALVIVGAIAGAYFLGSAGHRGSSAGTATGGSAEQTAQDLSARSLCQATLDRVHDFGVLPPDAALASSDAEQTGTKDRFVCTAKSGSESYKLTVDQHCSDMGDAKCLVLWNVADASGQSLFQHRDFLPPEE